MSGWVVVAVVIGVLVLAAMLRIALRGKDDRAASRELRRLRSKESNPDLEGAAEQRRNMYMNPMPGKNSLPGGP
jgi:hypothetical protein